MDTPPDTDTDRMVVVGVDQRVDARALGGAARAETYQHFSVGDGKSVDVIKPSRIARAFGFYMCGNESKDAGSQGDGDRQSQFHRVRALKLLFRREVGE